MATDVARGCVVTGVATRAVLTTDEHPGDDQQDYDENDDPEHFHPAWCAGIGRPVSHVRLHSSGVVVEVIVTAQVYGDNMSMSIQRVYRISKVSRHRRQRILG